MVGNPNHDERGKFSGGASGKLESTIKSRRRDAADSAHAAGVAGGLAASGQLTRAAAQKLVGLSGASKTDAARKKNDDDDVKKKKKLRDELKKNYKASADKNADIGVMGSKSMMPRERDYDAYFKEK